MIDHVDGWIPELVLGTLDGEIRRNVELHVGRCQRCAAEVFAMSEALSALALALPPEPPSRPLRTRLLASVTEEQEGRGLRASEPGPFADMVGRLAEFFDVTVERARTLIALMADPSSWTPGPAEGISLIHVEPGPRVARADVGFVRMAPGVRFPRHRHIGDEFSLILEGGIIDEDGTVVRAGEFHRLPADTSHDFTALPDQGCTFAAAVVDGIEFLEPLRRRRPRGA